MTLYIFIQHFPTHEPLIHDPKVPCIAEPPEPLSNAPEWVLLPAGYFKLAQASAFSLILPGEADAHWGFGTHCLGCCTLGRETAHPFVHFCVPGTWLAVGDEVKLCPTKERK